MHLTIKNLIWYLFLPAFLLFILFPLQLNGYLNPHDEGIWLGTLQMMLQGKRLYRDIFFHYGPVLPLGIQALLHFLPTTLRSMRLIIWMMNVAGLLCVYICLLKYVRTWYLRVVFAIFLFAIPLAAHILTIPMSARYGVGFASLLFWPIDEKLSKKKRWMNALIAGLLAGLAFGISQEVGMAAIVAGTCIFYGRYGFEGEFKNYCIGVALVVGVFLVYLASYSGVGAFLQCTGPEAARLVFIERNRFPSFFGGSPALFLAGALPALSYVVVLMVSWQKSSRMRNREVLIALVIYGLLTAISAWGRSDTWHIYFSLTPAVLLWAYFVDQNWSMPTRANLVKVAGVCLVLAGITLQAYFARLEKQEWIEETQRPTHLARAGSVQLPFPQANGYEYLVEWVHQHTTSDEPIFFYPYDGSIFFLADRPNPCYLPVPALAVNADIEARAVRELEASNLHWIIWDTQDTSFDGVPIGEFLPQISRFITAHYRPREKAGPFVFLERRPTVDSQL